MTRDPEKFLFDMLDSCRFLIELTKSEQPNKYSDDRVFRGAVQRELQIIGEAMLQLKTLDPAAAARFTEYERIIRFRHVLVHGYHELDPEIIWRVVQQKLPILRVELEARLKDAPPQ